jgi:hypothetical protein
MKLNNFDLQANFTDVAQNKTKRPADMWRDDNRDIADKHAKKNLKCNYLKPASRPTLAPWQTSRRRGDRSPQCHRLRGRRWSNQL